jgi:hypothetical protein
MEDRAPTMQRIVRVTTRPGYRLRITFANESRAQELDVSGLVAKGGVFAPLHNAALFDQVSVGEGGRWLQWPGDVELCADALWMASHGTHRLAA